MHFYTLLRPFTKRTASEMFDMVRNILEHNASHPDIRSISAQSRPVMQYGLVSDRKGNKLVVIPGV